MDVDRLDDFVQRNRAVLEAEIAKNLGPFLGRHAANRPMDEDIPELRSAAKRTAANIAAMAAAANLYAQKRTPNVDDRAALAGYSGWGGLPIQAAARRFPPPEVHPIEDRAGGRARCRAAGVERPPPPKTHPLSRGRRL